MKIKLLENCKDLDEFETDKKLWKKEENSCLHNRGGKYIYI